MEKYNTLKDKKDYELFIMNIPSYMNELSKVAGTTSLSFDEKEVRNISQYFINLNKKSLLTAEKKKIFVAYIGEAFMKRYGGEWFFTGLKKDSFALNEPVITKYKRESLRYCPSEDIFKIFETNDENHFNWANKYMEDFDAKTDAVFAQLFPKKNKRKKKD